jgi:signal transduction histidine kinase
MSDAHKLPSIRKRLLNALLVWSLVWTVAVSAAVWLAVHAEVEELLDETLQSAAQLLRVPLSQSTALAMPAAQSAPELAGAQFAWQVVRYSTGDSAFQLLASSPNAPTAGFHLAPMAGFVDSAGWRVYGLALGADGRMLYVAQDHTERSEAQFEVALSAALASLAIALLAHVWLRAKTRVELQPLQNLAERLTQHDPLKNAQGLGVAQRQELQSVHDAIDALGERLARRVANERAFSGHAAHALRTPLAGIDAQLAVALRECPPEMATRLQNIRSASARLQRVVAALLSLFRSGADLQREGLPLGAWLARLPETQLTLQVDAPAPLLADPDLLAAALINLLDNAVRHGARSVKFTMPSATTLRLHDDGSGITPERRAALSHAIQTQSYEGITGLGLMLADIVARAHGGQLTLPAVDSGFALELRLAGDI